MFSKITRPIDFEQNALIRAPGQSVVNVSGEYGDWVDLSILNQAYWHNGKETTAKIVTIAVHVEELTYVGSSLIMFTMLSNANDGSGSLENGGRLDLRAPGFYESTFNTDDLNERALASLTVEDFRYVTMRPILSAGNSLKYSAWVSQVLPA